MADVTEDDGDKTNGASKRKTKTTKASSQGKRKSSRKGKSASKNVDVHDVFRRELVEMNDAEEQVAEFLPKLAESVREPDLRELLAFLAQRSENYKRSLERVLQE